MKLISSDVNTSAPRRLKMAIWNFSILLLLIMLKTLLVALFGVKILGRKNPKVSMTMVHVVSTKHPSSLKLRKVTALQLVA